MPQTTSVSAEAPVSAFPTVGRSGPSQAEAPATPTPSFRMQPTWSSLEADVAGQKQRQVPRPGKGSGRPLAKPIGDRKLVQWILTYLALAWIVLQLTEAVGEIWSWPIVLLRSITLSLALGVLPAGIVAWYHGEKGKQRVCILELILMVTTIAGSAWVVWQVAG